MLKLVDSAHFSSSVLYRISTITYILLNNDWHNSSSKTLALSVLYDILLYLCLIDP